MMRWKIYISGSSIRFLASQTNTVGEEGQFNLTWKNLCFKQQFLKIFQSSIFLIFLILNFLFNFTTNWWKHKTFILILTLFCWHWIRWGQYSILLGIQFINGLELISIFCIACHIIIERIKLDKKALNHKLYYVTFHDVVLS